MNKSKIFYAFLIPIVLIACENQESQRKTTVNLGFKAVGNTLMQNKATRSAVADGIYIDTAMLVLEKIELKQQGEVISSYDPNDYILKGPYDIDLITKQSRPELLPAEVAPGIYTVLQAKLHIPEAYHYSMHIAGTYTNNDKWWRFIYEYPDTSVFRVESAEGINIVEGASNNIWVLIDVVALFEGIDFSKATPGADNIIRINSTSNSALGALIENNFLVAAIIDDGKGETPGNGNEASGDDQDDDDSGSSGNVSGKDDDDNSSRGDKADNGDDGNPGKVSGAGGNSNKDKVKDKDKDKNKDKSKDKNKEKNKQKVDNNKHKDKDKDKH